MQHTPAAMPRGTPILAPSRNGRDALSDQVKKAW
jgi:hypothetical protein